MNVTRSDDDDLERRWRGEAEESEYRRLRERAKITERIKQRERSDRAKRRRRADLP